MHVLLPAIMHIAPLLPSRFPHVRYRHYRLRFHLRSHAEKGSDCQQRKLIRYKVNFLQNTCRIKIYENLAERQLGELPL